MSTDLSIIIVNWNTRDLLARCLDSVAADRQPALGQRDPPASLQPTTHNPQPATHNLQLEVFVVDNASTDGSADMVRARFPWVRLIENSENVGFAAANNQAIRHSRGRYILLLNSDTEVQPGALQALVDFMEGRPDAGAVGAQLLNPDGSRQLSCHPMLTPERELWRLLFLEKIWPRATYPWHRWDAGTPRRVEVIKGACLLLRRLALDQVGLLDESYFMYTEEVDLCYRLAQKGWELWWLPQARVIHHEAQSTKQAAERMYLQLYRSKIQFFRKFGGERQAERFKWWLRLAYGPRAVVASLGAPFSPPWAARARTYRRLLAELTAM